MMFFLLICQFIKLEAFRVKEADFSFKENTLWMFFHLHWMGVYKSTAEGYFTFKAAEGNTVIKHWDHDDHNLGGRSPV